MSVRVGIVGPLPPPAGGMARQTFQLCQLLREEGVDVEILQTNAPYKPAFVERLKGVRALFRLVIYMVSVWRLCNRVDVIHLMANSGWSWQLFSAPVLWIASFRKTPVVVNYRGGEAEAYFKNSFSRVRPSLDKAQRVVVPSSFLKSVFTKFGVSTEVIPNIINLDRFHPVVRPQQSDAYHIVVTRNLEAIYGIDTAIRAMAKISEALPGARLSIAGTGPQLVELQTLTSELGIEHAVTFVGRLEPDEMAALYQSADLMINPSNVDNMPNSILESLACGVPVLTTSAGGIPHMVDHGRTAMLVSPGDVPAMAEEGVRLLLDPEARQKLADQGIEEVKKYAWPTVRNQWLDCYETLGNKA